MELTKNCTGHHDYWSELGSGDNFRDILSLGGNKVVHCRAVISRINTYVNIFSFRFFLFLLNQMSHCLQSLEGLKFLKKEELSVFKTSNRRSLKHYNTLSLKVVKCPALLINIYNIRKVNYKGNLYYEFCFITEHISKSLICESFI